MHVQSIEWLYGISTNFLLRLVLCLLLMMAKHAYFVIEQPANSLLQKAHRFETFINHTCYEPLIAILHMY